MISLSIQRDHIFRVSFRVERGNIMAKKILRQISLDNTIEFEQGLHAQNLEPCRDVICQQLEEKKSDVLIKLNDSHHIDGQGISLLLQCNNAVRELGKRLEVVTQNQDVKNMLELLNFGSKFQVTLQP